MPDNGPKDIFIGLMSGTSADGVDAVAVDFSKSAPLMLGCSHQPYPDELRSRIQALYVPSENEVDRLGSLDIELAHFYARCITMLLKQTDLAANAIIAVGCHGQTIRHRPRPQSGLPFTLQLGCPHSLAEECGIDIVADFRRRDMAAGGQGAPLAPAFHKAVFYSENEARAVVNIGGIANITLMTPGKPVLGYDIGPGNALMDAWCLLNTGHAYDANGAWAESGTPVPALLEALLAHPYFTLPPPKSTGREEFTLQWLQQILLPFHGLSADDVQATLVALTAQTIAGVCRGINKIYVCGGGSKNKYLMQTLAVSCKTAQVKTTADLGVQPEWIEAMAFAWLARQRVKGLPGNLPEVTGAKRSRLLGVIYPKA